MKPKTIWFKLFSYYLVLIFAAIWTGSLRAELVLEQYLENSDPFRDQIKRIFEIDTENKRYCFTGDRDFLFPLYDLEFLIGPKVNAFESAQETIKSFHKFLLNQEVELLVVFIPNKSQLLHPYLSVTSPSSKGPAPWSRDLASELQRGGLNTLHLYDPLKAALNSGVKPEDIYMLEDVHWAHKAIEIAGAAIAGKISQMGIKVSNERKEPFSLLESEVITRGICVKWLDKDHPRYDKALQSKFLVKRVFDNSGKGFQASQNSEFLLAGDSYMEMFFKFNAGIDAHLSNALSYRIDRLYQQGGGPAIPRIVMRNSGRYLNGKRLVIWMFVDRFLNSTSWRPI